VTGGLRKRAHSYLNVPSATVTDGRLSFKARGILAYLLDKPAGWDVRSASIATDGPDGKAAIQAGLRELARVGYYRIECRRLLDGRLVTGTAVSEEPVASWASEYAEYEGPVPVVQQPDGSFKVRRKDGSLTGDGFSATPAPEPEMSGAGSGGDDDGGVSAGRTGTRFSGAGSAGPGQTGAGSAGSGKPGASTNTEEPLQKPSPQPPGPLWPAAVADAQPEGEDEDQDFVPGLDVLVREVREIRPEWSSRSIRRALAHPDVTERGWDRARRAMLSVAVDPQSSQPGRLPHDGPWWNQRGAPSPQPPKPPWCGHCSSERERQVDLPGGTIGRCPACHPLAKTAPSPPADRPVRPPGLALPGTGRAHDAGAAGAENGRFGCVGSGAVPAQALASPTGSLPSSGAW
jgi:hypothetical protein